MQDLERSYAVSDLSLTKAIDICCAKEVTTAQAKLMSASGGTEQAVLAVGRHAPNVRQPHPDQASAPPTSSRSATDVGK